MIGLLLALSAWGATTAVVVDVHDGEVHPAAVEAAVWHALYDRHGHDALLLEDLDQARTLQERHLGELYHLEVRWDPLVMDVNGVGKLGSLAPTVVATEYVLHGDRLEPTTTWTTYGALALYEVHRSGSTSVVALPQVALQETIGLAVDPVRPPVWHDAPPDLLTIPVVVAADEEYRDFYGYDWKLVADVRIERASALLAQAGLRLEVVDHQDWRTDDSLADLDTLLDDLAAQPRAGVHTLRVGFTQQTGLAQTWDESLEDVGRAYRPGEDVLVADQAMAPGHARAWDEAEEGAAIAHEVLHALGLPHMPVPGSLMADTKSGTVYTISPATRELARAAAMARYAHWDAVTAMNGLAEVAREYLPQRQHQLDYITGNLHTGLGVPAAGQVRPGELMALSNAAMARYYLDLAEREPGNADALRQTALAHSAAALEAEPDLDTAAEVMARLEELMHPRPPKPAPAPKPLPPTATLGHQLPWFGTGTPERTE